MAVSNIVHYFQVAEIGFKDRKSTRLNSSHVEISYAVFCLKKKKYCSLKPLACPTCSTLSGTCRPPAAAHVASTLLFNRAPLAPALPPTVAARAALHSLVSV